MVGCLLAPVSVLAVWTANQVSSTSRYVDNVEPLVHNPAVKNALTGKLSEVQSVAELFGMNFWNDEGFLTHSFHTVVIDRKGRLAANPTNLPLSQNG